MQRLKKYFFLQENPSFLCINTYRDIINLDGGGAVIQIYSHYTRASFSTISDGFFSTHPWDVIGFLCRMPIKFDKTRKERMNIFNSKNWFWYYLWSTPVILIPVIGKKTGVMEAGVH